MERLTYWNETTNRYEVNDNGTIHSGSITDRLAEYEGTGLEPSEIFELQEKYEALEDGAKNAYSLYREYKDAEEQGLLIKLPPDGQIYHIEESIETNERWIGNKPCHYITSEGYHCGWGIGTVCFKFDELGKTVFLTREEAEAKLKGGAPTN